MLLARHARKKSCSGCYHIILRGVNRQTIFHDDDDRRRFLDTLVRYKDELYLDIITYCLMTNHIHILLHCEGDPDQLVKKIASSYVYYFNHKYDRVGHLFQARFRSEPVEDPQYLLTVTRYILMNPEKAGIASMADYPWSGWHDIDHERVVNMALVEDLFDDREEMKSFLLLANEDNCLEGDDEGGLSDEAALRVAQGISCVKDPHALALLPTHSRNEWIRRLKAAGLSGVQIARCTGISTNIIYKAIGRSQSAQGKRRTG